MYYMQALETSALIMSVGLISLQLTVLAPGMQKLTTSTSILQVFTRRLTTIVGTVAPSAVWYTS